jgi:lactam utilization protein B
MEDIIAVTFPTWKLIQEFFAGHFYSRDGGLVTQIDPNAMGADTSKQNQYIFCVSKTVQKVKLSKNNYLLKQKIDEKLIKNVQI